MPHLILEVVLDKGEGSEIAAEEVGWRMFAAQLYAHMESVYVFVDCSW